MFFILLWDKIKCEISIYWIKFSSYHDNTCGFFVKTGPASYPHYFPFESYSIADDENDNDTFFIKKLEQMIDVPEIGF